MGELREARDRAVEADMVELRLDTVDRPDVAGALADRRKPVIVTCRAAWEGGFFRGSEEERLGLLAEAHAQSFGAVAEVQTPRGYPVLVNHSAENEFARRVALKHVGEDKVDTLRPITASEDFAFLLEKRPGAYLFVGNGPSADLHSPKYNFNDEILPIAARYWVALAEDYLSANEEARAA